MQQVQFDFGVKNITLQSTEQFVDVIAAGSDGHHYKIHVYHAIRFELTVQSFDAYFSVFAKIRNWMKKSIVIIYGSAFGYELLVYNGNGGLLADSFTLATEIGLIRPYAADREAAMSWLSLHTLYTRYFPVIFWNKTLAIFSRKCYCMLGSIYDASPADS